MVSEGNTADRGEDLTSIHVHRALDGDRDSLGWLVARLTPLLRMQAAMRIRATPLGITEIEDIVAEAWLITIRRLDALTGPEGRPTPRLVRFLSTTVLNLVNQRLDALIRRRRVFRDAAGEDRGDPLDRFDAEITGVVTRATRAELSSMVMQAIDSLSEQDRDVVVLRGVEGLSNQEAAEELDEEANTVSHRYRRALAKLRDMLPSSVFAELEDD